MVRGFLFRADTGTSLTSGLSAWSTGCLQVAAPDTDSSGDSLELAARRRSRPG